MAYLLSAANGNWTDAASWKVSATGASATQLTRSTYTNSTTSYVYSPAFTVTNLEVLDGIALWVTNLSNTGTLTVALSDDGGTTATREVTINVSDIRTETMDSARGLPVLVFFKFGSTLTADGGSDYKIGIKTSTSATVSVFRDATAANWTRVLRTTTTQAPAASDICFVIGEFTAAATYTGVTVTMNETASTDHGDLHVGSRGTLSYGVTAATDYLLHVQNIYHYHYGTLNIGTSGTPIPSDSTATLKLNCSSPGQYTYYQYGGTWEMAADDTRVHMTNLTADAAATATILTVGSTTGWQAGDQLIITSTTRGYTEGELRTISTVDSATQVTLTAGLTYGHSGTGTYTKAEVANYTRNINVTGGSSANYWKYLCSYTANYLELTWSYACLQYCGDFYAAGTLSLTIDIDHSVMHVSSGPTYPYSWYTTQNIAAMTYTNNIVYHGTAANFAMRTAGVLATTISSCLFYGPGQLDDGTGVAQTGVASATGNSNDAYADPTKYPVTMTDCVFTGDSSANLYGWCLSAGVEGSGNVFHSNRGAGVTINQVRTSVSGAPVNGIRMSNCVSYRNGTYGLYLGYHTTYDVVLDGWELFGNAQGGVFLGTASQTEVHLIACNIYGEGAYSQPYGLLASSNMHSYYCHDGPSLHDCVLSTHTIDVYINFATVNPAGTLFHAKLINCQLNSATQITCNAGFSYVEGCGLFVQKHDQLAGDHRFYKKYHTGITDTTIYSSASPSLRLTPNHATKESMSPTFKVPVASGETCTPSIKVRESVVGDGTDYNGNRIKLYVKRNYAAGITDDTLLDTATSASEGAFETLTGTTAAVDDDCVLEFYVTCDGTTGWINVDDWDSTTPEDAGGLKFWSHGLPWAVDGGVGGVVGGISRARVQGVM